MQYYYENKSIQNRFSCQINENYLIDMGEELHE